MNAFKPWLFCLLLCLGPLYLSLSFASTSDLPYCEEFWKNLKKTGQDRYNYSKDATFTEKGNEGYKAYAQRVNRSQCRKKWDVLVFMAADAPDLSPYAMWDIDEMESGYKSKKIYAGSTQKNDVLVELDTFENKKEISRLHLFQTDVPFQKSRNLEFYQSRTEKMIYSPIVEFLPEIGSGSINDQGQRLINFLKFAEEKYPADHYALVIWGHGRGWAGPQTTRENHNLVSKEFFLKSSLNKSASEGPNFDGGVAFDYSQRTYLDIPSLKEVLRQFQIQRGNQKPLDILINDACLMQMIEVATEVAQYTRFIVGTGQIQSFLGLPYRRILMELNSNRFDRHFPKQLTSLFETDEYIGPYWSGYDGQEDSAYLFAKMIPDLYRKSYDPSRGLHGPYDTEAHKTMILSTISSDALLREGLPAVKDFSRKLLDLMKVDLLFQSSVFSIMQKTPSYLGSARDLGIFLGMLEQNLRESLTIDSNYFQIYPQANKLNESIKKLLHVLDKIVISKIYGSSYQDIWADEGLLVNYFKGLTAFIPEDKTEFTDKLDDFLPGEFYQLGAQGDSIEGSWPTWIKSALQI